MRYLFLTLGAPASGKTTFIEVNNLKQYAVSSDDLRAQVSSNKGYMEGNTYKEGIDYDDEGFVWEVLRLSVERRMSQGETVIVDATHLFKGAFGNYIELSHKWNYKIILIDFMDELITTYGEQGIIAELIRRDKIRGDKIGDASVFENYVNRYINIKSQKFNSFITISPEKFMDTYVKPVKPVSMDEFNKITIIGDVHGDYSSLNKVFENHKKGDAYIFVGDYLDRGLDNVGVFNFVNNLRGRNITLLRGNHEQRIEQWTANHEKRGKFGKVTLTELFKGGVTDKDMENLVSKLEDYKFFTFHGKTFMVTHAGLEPTRVKEVNGFTNEHELVMGLGERHKTPYDVNIDNKYALSSNSIVNVHGHRNTFNQAVVTAGEKALSINLTKDGKFRTLVITDDGTMHPTEWDSIDSPTFVDTLYSDPDVKEKSVAGTDIIAHNFTKDVFFQKGGNRWTPRTLSARGMFTRENDIVGRGFKKFFNVDENDTSGLDTLTYPVELYVKWNGFLGISFWDDKISAPRFLTKGGMEEWTPNKAKNPIVLKNIVEHTGYLSLVSSYLEEHKENSVLFEMITPDDKHIIDYDDTVMSVPIAVINNETGLPVMVDEVNIFDINPLKHADNEEELRNILADIDTWEDPIEGVVIRGQNKMLKYKTSFYKRSKEMRGRLGIYNRVGPKKFKEGFSDPNKWYYGAQDWTNRAIENNETEFSPKLALQFYQEDDYKI